MLIKCPVCGSENLNTLITCTACGCALTTLNSVGYQLPSGTLLQQGKYTIEKTLGEGGFGITYKAIDLENFTNVAIKELCPDKFLNMGLILSGLPLFHRKLNRNKFKNLRLRRNL